jgi:3-hydroxy-D-aspartate aldolase
MTTAAHDPPALVGTSLEDVDTPALLLDLDVFERNLEALDAALAASSVRVRPHAKPHKCPDIARRQIARGAVGVCCQKVSEAEAFVRGGVTDILVTNQIVGAPKLKRLARLACAARIGVCVDDADNVEDLERAAAAAQVTIRVLVEVDVGGHRCGVAPGAPVVELAAKVAASPHLRFDGLQAYHGRAQHLRRHEERRAAIRAAVDAIQTTLVLLEARALRAEVVTGAGTGTVEFEAASGVYTEVQPGSYIFMDADYGRNLGPDGEAVRDFQQSLFVLTTVMSRARPGRVVLDAGLKAHSVDSGMPLVADVPGAVYTGASDEHGVVDLRGGGSLALGQKLRLIPGHCDPTVNMYDWLVCVRSGRVEEVWPIAARGAGY